MSSTGTRSSATSSSTTPSGGASRPASPGPASVEPGPPAELTPLDLFARLLDPDFYAVLPDGAAFTPAEGLAAYEAAVAWAAESDPFDPAAPGLGDVLDGPLLAFAQAVAATKATDVRLLGPLRAYLAAGLGYIPRLVLLYYRGADGTPRVVEF